MIIQKNAPSIKISLKWSYYLETILTHILSYAIMNLTKGILPLCSLAKTIYKILFREELKMAISLQKGQKIDLTKTNPGLTQIMVGLGWDVNKYDGGSEFDLDASAFLLGASGKAESDSDFIFYGNQKHPSGSVQSMGDNTTGEGEGDDEQILIDLSKVPANVDKIDFTVTIYDADKRNQNFGQVSNAYIRIVDNASGTELIRYDLSEDFSIETAVIAGELYRNGSEWKFNAIGSGFSGGLAALCANFGLNAG